ncbi:uncharacterized protein [Aegilops tauschii subsp. strangulata]|uniref:uncharacterized protein n=1 Tax=Aegilops tauschii subsp. strangulata TaxID=200361 RepID=UPI00098A8229|nr:uncharacterized protein LOC109773813 [Aegilops tauschii subsp. strangulata]XP_044444938.1 uncharacterized protein LOC123171551 [Triticum aestivum]
MATLCWSVDVKGGEALRSRVLDGRRGAVTSVSLVGPPSGRSVAVEAYVKTASGTLALASLSSERPRAELPRPVLVMESDFFCSRVRLHGGDPAGDVAVAVRFEGRFNDHVLPPPPLCEGLEDEDGDDEDDEDDNSEAEEYSVDSEDEEDDSSSEEEEDEESDGEVDGQAASADDDVTLGSLQTLHRRKFVPEGQGQLVGGSAPRFACAGRTLGFMRVAAVESEGGDESKQILVLYRYTHFKASPDGVEQRGRTKEHQLRFIATGDHAARSLAWAGSSLGLLIYPDILSKNKKLQEITKQLQELWSSLASQVSVPPGARRVEVFVDVGILRRADYTPASMGHMYTALESMVADPWPGRFVGMELHLPVPVRSGTEGHDDDDSGRSADERPAKRRRVDVAGEDCPVCLQLLDGDDLAAWPGCGGKPHVFHGACLEGVLQNSEICRMCRHKLDIKHKLE